MKKQEVRVDKFLWAVRLYKTRSLASEECKKGRVLMREMQVKSSRLVKAGDEIQVKRPPITYTYKVIQVADKRMGAKLVPDFLEDVTTKDQIELLELQKINNSLNRDRGAGRPTKRDRRQIEEFTDQDDDFSDWD